MAISKVTLAALQKTGAIAHNLKLTLRAETKKYSDRLSKALSSSPNGNAFELLDGPEISNWKSVGTLSKMVDAIEAELITAFKFASGLVTGLPQASAKKPDVAGTQAKAANAKKAAPNAQAPALKGVANSEKLLAKLETTLSGNEFTILKQTELAKSTGIPLGSMTAALKKLTAMGALALGKNGGYKLGKKRAAPAPTAELVVAPVKQAKVAAKSVTPKATAAVAAEASAPKAVAKKKAVAVAAKVATKATVTKTVAVVNKHKLVKPVVTATKPAAKAAMKKAPVKKVTPVAKPAVAAATQTEAVKNEAAAETTAQSQAVAA